MNWKLSGEKNIPEYSRQQNLNFPHASNNLHSIYIVLGILDEGNLDKVYGIMDKWPQISEERKVTRLREGCKEEEELENVLKIWPWKCVGPGGMGDE